MLVLVMILFLPRVSTVVLGDPRSKRNPVDAHTPSRKKPVLIIPESWCASLLLLFFPSCRGGPLADDDGLDAVLSGNKAGGRGGESDSLEAIIFIIEKLNVWREKWCGESLRGTLVFWFCAGVRCPVIETTHGQNPHYVAERARAARSSINPPPFVVKETRKWWTLETVCGQHDVAGGIDMTNWLISGRL